MAWERDREPYRPMESPGVLFFRVVVMLSCLILVPLAAIFGSAFPEVVKTQLVDRIKSLVGLDDPGDAVTPSAVSIDSSPANTSGVQPANWHSPEPAPNWQPAVSQATAYQADYTSLTPPPAQTPAAPATAAMSPAPRAVDHFTEIQHRLRDYGASHYALESIEPANNAYRFHCTMTLPGTANSQRFEAIDRDPLQAMASVLSQVEAWRNNLQSPAVRR